MSHNDLPAHGRLPSRAWRCSPSRRERGRAPSGMTLLELILALALSGMLLMAITMALHIHWKAFDVRRSSVEEAQLVRSIRDYLERDLRGTMRFEPLDTSGLNLTSAAAGLLPEGMDALAAAGAGGSPTGGSNGSTSTPGSGSGGNQSGTPSQSDSPPGGGGSPSSGGSPSANNGQSGSTGSGGTGATSGSGTTGSSGSGSQSSDAEGDSTAAAASGPSVVVGLYGSATELQFDISRLPRVDQFQSLGAADDTATEILSDIKTVIYFLGSPETMDSSSGAISSDPSGATGSTGGLMRAESDRAVSAFGEINGAGQTVYGGAKLLAPEVTSLAFQYFDGTEWLTEWNSDEQGGLPLAVEVQMTIATAQDAANGVDTSLPAAAPLSPDAQGKVYRMVIHLPVGGKCPESEESEASMEGEDAMSTDGSSDPGAGTNSGTPSGGNGSPGGGSPNSGGSPNGGGAPNTTPGGGNKGVQKQ